MWKVNTGVSVDRAEQNPCLLPGRGGGGGAGRGAYAAAGLFAQNDHRLSLFITSDKDPCCLLIWREDILIWDRFGGILNL